MIILISFVKLHVTAQENGKKSKREKKSITPEDKSKRKTKVTKATINKTLDAKVANNIDQLLEKFLITILNTEHVVYKFFGNVFFKANNEMYRTVDKGVEKTIACAICFEHQGVLWMFSNNTSQSALKYHLVNEHNLKYKATDSEDLHNMIANQNPLITRTEQQIKQCGKEQLALFVVRGMHPLTLWENDEAKDLWK